MRRNIDIPIAARTGPAENLADTEKLEDAYAEWEAKWHHALDLGGFGDLFELRDALNAACPKSCKSS